MENTGVPAVAANAVLVQSGKLPVEPVEVKGYDFNQGVDYHALLQTFRTSGFQATNFGMAVEEINRMVSVLEPLIPRRNVGYHCLHLSVCLSVCLTG